MKRKILSVLSVLMAVLMSTAAFSACSKAPAGAENSGGSGESFSESSESGGESESSEENEQRTALFKELNEEYLPLYGILINDGEWNSPEEIGVAGFYIWYAEYIIANTTVEERFEKYSGNSESGCWAFPAEEFEGFVQRYFNVSTDFLRSSDIYSAKNGWYDIGGADRWLSDYSFSVVSPDDISISGSTATAKLTCASNLDSKKIFMYLSIDISEKPYKFIGCKSDGQGGEKIP